MAILGCKACSMQYNSYHNVLECMYVCVLWHDSFFSFNGIQNVFIFHKGCVTFLMLLCFLFIKIWVELCKRMCCITVSYTIRSKVIGILISFFLFLFRFLSWAQHVLQLVTDAWQAITIGFISCSNCHMTWHFSFL